MIWYDMISVSTVKACYWANLVNRQNRRSKKSISIDVIINSSNNRKKSITIDRKIYCHIWVSWLKHQFFNIADWHRLSTIRLLLIVIRAMSKGHLWYPVTGLTTSLPGSLWVVEKKFPGNEVGGLTGVDCRSPIGVGLTQLRVGIKNNCRLSGQTIRNIEFRHSLKSNFRRFYF